MRSQVDFLAGLELKYCEQCGVCGCGRGAATSAIARPAPNFWKTCHRGRTTNGGGAGPDRCGGK